MQKILKIYILLAYIYKSLHRTLELFTDFEKFTQGFCRKYFVNMWYERNYFNIYKAYE